MRKLAVAFLAICFIVGCTPVEREAYNTIVASKGFLDSVKAAHKECPAAGTTTCVDLTKATAAKDLLIDAVEAYCASPSFDQNGGTCTPPNKSDPKYQQLAAKLQSALTGYKQAESDLKGVTK